VVLLDDRAAAWPAPEQFEDACEAAASVLVAAVREDLSAELLLLTGSDAVGAKDHQAVGPSAARRVDARPLLDRLAEAELTTGAPAGTLERTVARLRQFRLGDTLVHLTGTPAAEDLAQIGALRGRYPTIVAGVFGDPASVPSTVEGVHVLAVTGATHFATAWDGIGRW
jgi:hypothetical protein